MPSDIIKGHSDFGSKIINQAMEDNVIQVDNKENASGYIIGQMSKDENSLICTNPDNEKINNHIAVVGSTGSGKTKQFIEPYILQAMERHESIIVTDAYGHGQLYEKYADLFEQNGYVVKCFNSTDAQNSDSWNCLHGLQSEFQANHIAMSIISNTSDKEEDNVFWETAAENLLIALILRVSFGNDFSDVDKNMKTVYGLIGKAAMEGVSILDKLFSDNGITEMPDDGIAPKSYALHFYNTFQQIADSTKHSVLIDLLIRLQIYQNKSIANITSENNIDLILPKSKPCVYFVELNEGDFLSPLFISCLLTDLYDYTEKNKDGCKMPVNVVLDEFQNIGSIPNFQTFMATVKNRGINIVIAVQSISQLHDKYPNDEWKAVLSNFDTLLFMGCADAQTAMFISDMAGSTTIKPKALHFRFNKTYKEPREVSRKIFTIEEILRMPIDECLIFIRGYKVLRAFKIQQNRK